MSAPLLEVADALVALLNTATLSVPVVATRKYLTVFAPETLAALETLTVTVVPVALVGSKAAREGEFVELSVAVHVQQRVDMSLPAIDVLMALVQEIIDTVKYTTVSSLPAMSTGYENDPVFSPEDLGQMRLFTSTVVFHFRILR